MDRRSCTCTDQRRQRKDQGKELIGNRIYILECGSHSIIATDSERERERRKEESLACTTPERNIKGKACLGSHVFLLRGIRSPFFLKKKNRHDDDDDDNEHRDCGVP